MPTFWHHALDPDDRLFRDRVERHDLLTFDDRCIEKKFDPMSAWPTAVQRPAIFCQRNRQWRFATPPDPPAYETVYQGLIDDHAMPIAVITALMRKVIVVIRDVMAQPKSTRK